MNRNAFFARASFAALILASIFTAATAAPGATPGDGDVSSTGAATYSIPIRIPGGVNGLQPNLALSYHSRAGSGHAGQGWNIAGIPEIRRCGQFYQLDGKQTGVSLNANDRFCLNGERLVSGTGTYGANGATYYTEIESYAKVTSYTSGGAGSAPASGPQWFKVETPDGLIYEYGKTVDSRLEGVGTTVPHVWTVNRITDPNGNYIEFVYLEYTDKGAHYPREIKYTGTASAAPIYSIYFTWPLKPTAEQTTHYLAGTRQRIERRLGTIQLRHNGSEFRRYNLSYETSTSPSGRSRLASVQECAGSDCLPATNIDWHALAAGVTASAEQTVTNRLQNARLMDVDGDGRKDLVYDSGGTWRIQLATATPGQNIAFASAVDTGRAVVNADTAVPIDFNGDGRTDLLYRGADNKWHVLRSNGTGFLTPLATVSLNYHGDSLWPTDINGDGLDDVIYGRETVETHQWPGPCEPGAPCHYNTGYAEIFYRLNTGSNFGAEVKALHIANKALSPVAFPQHWRYKSTSAMPDFNGDGVADLMVLLSPVPDPNCLNCDNPNTWTWFPMNVGTGSFSAISGLSSLPYHASPLVMDFNGDGNSDLAYADTSVNRWRIYVSTGTEFGTPVTTDFVRNGYVDKAVALDYDNDGRDDIVTPDAGNWRVARSTGTNFQALQTLMPWKVDQFARVGDFDGDGDGDLLFLRPSGSTLYWQRGRNNGEFGDLVSHVADGLGNEVRFSYGTSADPSVHWAYSAGTAMTVTRMFVPYALVKEVKRSDGNGGLYGLQYIYEKGRRAKQGRGFLGFNTQNIIDLRDGSRLNYTFNNTYPLMGKLSWLVRYRKNPQAGTLAFSAESSFEPDSYGEFESAGGDSGYTQEPSVSPLYAIQPDELYEEIVKFNWSQASSFSTQGTRILLSSRWERRYFVPGGLSYDFTTTYTGYDAWGNPATVTHARTDDAVNFPSVTISNLYDNSISSRRCPGRLTASTTTYKSPGKPDVVETQAMSWDAAKCRPTSQEREPASATHRVRTDYGYDGFGNVSNVTVSGAGVAPRETQIGYDPLGYRQSSVTNALNQSASVSWDPALRHALAVYDLDGNPTSYEYDAFDRMIEVTRPDGSYATIDIASCSSNCDSGKRKLIVTETLYEPGGTSQGGQRKRWLDSLGRVRHIEQSLLDGVLSRQRIDYDGFGRVESRSMPYTGSAPAVFAYYSYDDYGRPLTVELPGEQGQPSRTVEYLYALESASTHEHYTRVTDPEGRSTTQYFDTLGRPTRVRDALGNDIVYAYDAAGRLTSTTDPDNNVISIGYDILGRRVSLNDPNLGAWSFEHNVYGELVSQTDAKSQTTTFSYDALGRLIQRVDPDGTSTWTYDTATGAGTGKLHQLAGPNGYLEEYAYDALGRPLQQTLNFDASSYQYDFDYDAFSRLSRITYPESVMTAQGNRFAVDYAYDASGAPSHVANANDPTEIFWQASAMNAFGQITTAILGNDITSVKEIDPHTGRLKTLRSFAQGQPELWNLHYEYSPSGNVTARENTVQGLRETFGYDALNRLETHHLNGNLQQTVYYDAIGNITHKTGIGDYTYGGPRPHAVTATSTGNVTYQYDPNGNMTQRGTTAIDWNAANLPTQITQGSDQLTFHYGPNRSRYKQVANIGGQTITTHYIGGLMEAIGGNGVVQYRHSIIAAGEVIAQHTRDSNAVDGNPRTVYTQRDMLGSIGLITDENAAVIGQMHFDPWGKRIDATDWDGAPSATDIAAIRDVTHRGFTGHEMLDAVNLVHMNGRIYDPYLGRMLSADPINSEPDNLQRYNRYSYVNNSPMSYTDPSGLDRIGTPWAVYWICRDACDSHSPENREGGGESSVASDRLTTDDRVEGQSYTGQNGDGVPFRGVFASSTPLPVGQFNGLPAGGLGNLIDNMNARVTARPRPELLDTPVSAGSVAIPAGGLSGSGEGVRSFIRFGARIVSPVIAMLSLRSDSKQNKNEYIHYGFASQAESFSGGLWPGSYATKGPLMDGQTAQQMLSLPHPSAPDAYYLVNVPDSVPVIGPMPVDPDFGQPGGGVQFRFPEGTPPGSVTGPYPLPSRL